jgi:DNA-directed RNA polymerase specialized sigma24 family protein
MKDLRSGNVAIRDEAAARIWSRYAGQLLELARNRLSTRIKPREDEEDVLQRMYHSFCRRMAKDELTWLENRDDLLKLLIIMTKKKVLRVANHHTRERRDVGRERAREAGRDGTSSWPTLEEEVPTADAAPEDAKHLEKMLTDLLLELPEVLRRIALWKVERWTNKEIATKLGVVERTVERRVDLIRIALLEQEGCTVEEIADKLGQTVARIELKRTLLEIMRRQS